MRVTINNEKTSRQEVQKGFFSGFKTPKTINEFYVSVKIELSEEERAIIAQYNLWDYVLFENPFYIPPDQLAKNPILASQAGIMLPTSIKDFIEVRDGRSFGRTFGNPVDAANFQRRLETEILPKLKNYLVATKEAGTQTSKTFEL